MSLVNQQVGSYRLVRKLGANQNYKIYQAKHIRSSEERIIQLVKLEGKLNKKENRTRLRKKIESLRAINSAHVIPILEYDFAKIKGNNYFYTRIPCFLSGSLKEWLQIRAKTNPLSQQDVDNIMHQAREAVEVFHKSGIAHLNLELSSFMIEMTENSNCPRVFLNDFLLAVLSTERIREDEVRRKQAITEDQNALKEMEKLLIQNVEETVIKPEESLESLIQILERRLVIAEEEKGQLQRKLRELEEEKEHIIQELQEQREGERRHQILAEEEKERIIRDLREQKESDTKLLAEAIVASTGASGVAFAPLAASGGGTSHRSGRWFWGLVLQQHLSS